MFKKTPYLRYVLILITYIILWPINFVIAPLLWMLGVVDRVREKRIPILVWFVNTDEPDNKQNNYGDNNYLMERGISDIETRNVLVRLYWYIIWCVFRNSYFHFKINVIKPLSVKEEVVKVYTNTVFGPNASRLENLHVCDYSNRGKIHVLEKRNDTLYFRYSFTKEIKLFGLFGKYLWNVQLGVNGITNIWGSYSTNRYLYKSKLRKL